MLLIKFNRMVALTAKNFHVHLLELALKMIQLKTSPSAVQSATE